MYFSHNGIIYHVSQIYSITCCKSINKETVDEMSSVWFIFLFTFTLWFLINEDFSDPFISFNIVIDAGSFVFELYLFLHKTYWFFFISPSERKIFMKITKEFQWRDCLCANADAVCLCFSPYFMLSVLTAPVTGNFPWTRKQDKTTVTAGVTQLP